MNETSNHTPKPLSLEEGAKVLLNNARQGIHHRHRRCEDRIRKHPTTAVLGAIAVGYFLHRMPVRAIHMTRARQWRG